VNLNTELIYLDFFGFVNSCIGLKADLSLSRITQRFCYVPLSHIHKNRKHSPQV